MNLHEILKPECIKAPLQGADKKAVIDELVDVLASQGLAPDPAGLKKAVWTREQIKTTGIGHGLAIPHGKNEGMKSLAMAIGKPAAPMEFEAMDGRPVFLIVLLASPPDRTSDHIQALASVSRIMNVTEFRERIYEAESGEEIYELLKKHETGV